MKKFFSAVKFYATITAVVVGLVALIALLYWLDHVRFVY